MWTFPRLSQTRLGDWKTNPLPFVALFIFTIVMRIPALTFPRAMDDEQVYAVVGMEMFHGGLPYVDAIERKPPLLFLLYEGLFRIGGAYNMYALHVAMLLVTLVSMTFLYRTLRDLFDAPTGLAGAFLYSLFMCWSDRRILALNGELLMNLPILIAYFLAFASSTKRFRYELFFAGAFIGIAFLLKQPAAIAGLPLGLYVFLPGYRRTRRLKFTDSVIHALFLGVGCASLISLMAVWLHQHGILRDAYYWTIGNHSLDYGVLSWLFWFRLPQSLGLALVELMPLLGLTVLAIRGNRTTSGLWHANHTEYVALLAFSACSLIGVSASGQWLYHYFLQLIPPFCLLAAPALNAILSRTIQVPFPFHPRPIFNWLAVMAVVFLVINSLGVTTDRHPGAAGSYVLTHSEPTDRLFVWGQGTHQTGIYLDAERRPASRFIASFPLTGHIFGIFDPKLDTTHRILPGSWDQLKTDLDRNLPRYIIDCEAVAKNKTLYPITRYPWLYDYLTTRYTLVYRAKDGDVYERRVN
jgi:hypothetical protein